MNVKWTIISSIFPCLALFCINAYSSPLMVINCDPNTTLHVRSYHPDDGLRWVHYHNITVKPRAKAVLECPSTSSCHVRIDSNRGRAELYLTPTKSGFCRVINNKLRCRRLKLTARVRACPGPRNKRWQ